MSDARVHNSMIARNVRFLRLERGLTDRAIEVLSKGVLSKSLIGKIEKASHRYKIPNEHVRIVAEVLNVTEDVIYESNKYICHTLDRIESDLTHLVKFEENEIINQLDSLIWRTSTRAPGEFAKSLLLRGRVEYHLTRYKNALKYLEMSKSIAVKAQDYEMEFRANYDIISVLLAQGRVEKAFDLTEEELDRIRIMINLEDAARLSKKPEKVHILDPQTKIAKMHYFLAYTYSLQRDWENAKRECLLALDNIPKTPNNNILVGSYYQALGDCYKNLPGHSDDCIRACKESVRIAVELNDPIRQVYALKTMGEMWYRKEQIGKAFANFTKASQLTSSIALRSVDYKKLTFWIALCEGSLENVVSALDELECIVQPRDFSELAYEAALLAEKIGDISAIKLYKLASQRILF